jgi:hypothetical protein
MKSATTRVLIRTPLCLVVPSTSLQVLRNASFLTMVDWLMIHCHDGIGNVVDEMIEVAGNSNDASRELELVTAVRTYRLKPLSDEEYAYWRDGLRLALSYWYPKRRMASSASLANSSSMACGIDRRIGLHTCV